MTRTGLEGGWLRRLLRSSQAGGIGLWVLFLLLLALVTREVARAAASPAHRTGWLEPEWVGVEPAVTLLVAVASVLTVRRQLALGNRPFLTYTCHWLRLDEPPRVLLNAPERVWVVTVRNAGPGTAVVARAEYSATVVTSGGTRSLGPCAAAEFRTALVGLGLRIDVDVGIVAVGANSAIEPSGILRLCELPPDVGSWLTALDVVIEYRSLMGQAYFKRIRCVPPDGLPAVPDDAVLAASREFADDPGGPFVATPASAPPRPPSTSGQSRRPRA